MPTGNWKLSEDQVEIKNSFIDQRGYWLPAFEYLLQLDPKLIKKYLKLEGYTIDESPLDEKTRAYVLLALNAATTHMNETGIRTRINDAFDAGASVDEIVAVLEITSVLGIHAMTTGVETLSEISGLPDRTTDEHDELEQKRQAYKDELGFWSDRLDAIVEYDDEYFDNWYQYLRHPQEADYLTPAQMELIYVAIDVSTTHLYQEGLELHIKKALDVGATPNEIVSVFELASLMSVQSTTEGIPILVEEAQRRGKLPREPTLE